MDRRGPRHGERVLTTRELRADLLGADGRPKWSIAPATPVDLDGGEARPLDPYEVGQALGDGSGARPGDDRVPAAYRNAPSRTGWPCCRA